MKESGSENLEGESLLFELRFNDGSLVSVNEPGKRIGEWEVGSDGIRQEIIRTDWRPVKVGVHYKPGEEFETGKQNFRVIENPLALSYREKFPNTLWVERVPK